MDCLFVIKDRQEMKKSSNTAIPRKSMGGFTLIELLVVIAIIAILLAILIPSLKIAKETATTIVCLSHIRTLAQGGVMYATENDEKLFSSNCPDNQSEMTGAMNGDLPPWVMPPLQYTPVALLYPFGMICVGTGDQNVGGPLLLDKDSRINGIREGALFPYVSEAKMFHCMGDPRLKKGASDSVGSVTPSTPLRYWQTYNSYGMPTFYGGGVQINKIKIPSSAIFFIEYQYDRKFNSADWGYNVGGYEWDDPLGNYHDKACTFSFVDGHAEHHKWRDQRTIIFMSDRDAISDEQPGNVDMDWMDQAYPKDGTE